MAAYTYGRIITIGGADFTLRAEVCNFNWKKNIGCDTASITIKSVPFDDTAGIQIDDPVVISFTDGEVWWNGIVTNLTTTLTGGLQVQASGNANTILQERTVGGIYGSKIFIPHADNIVSEITKDSGNIGEGYHKYIITACDEQGERVSSDALDRWYTEHGSGLNIAVTGYYEITKEVHVDFAAEEATALSIKLTWDDDDRISHWRIYKQFSTAQVALPVGAGNDSSLATPVPEEADKLYYIEVTTPEFIDDGTIDWANASEKEEPDATELEMPRYDTCRVPTISDTGSPYAGGVGNTSVRAIARHLVLTYWEDGFDLTAMEYGEHIEVDDFDFDTDESNLAEALETLANYAGKAVYGVNQDGKVFFSQRKDADENAEVLKSFAVGQAFNWKDVYSDDTFVTDVLINATRVLTRDGASDVQVNADDRTTAKRAAEAQAQHLEPLRFDGDFPTLHPRHNTRKPHVFRAHLVGKPEIPASKAAWYGAYADSMEFEAAYPNMGAMWRLKDIALGGAQDWLEGFVNRLRNAFHPDTAPGRQGGQRRRGISIVASGVTTEQAAIRSAANIADEHAPVVGKWNLELTNGGTLFKPGEGVIEVINLQNVKYRMAIQNVTYDFGDTVKTTMECGEPDIVETAARHKNKAVTKLINRNPYDMPVAGTGNPLTKIMRKRPRASAHITFGTPGVSNVPAAIDHEHPYDVLPLNTLIEKDGTHHPNVQRAFAAAGTTELAAYVDTEDPAYKRGLKYKEGDYAVIKQGVGATQFMQRRVSVPAAYNGSDPPVDTHEWYDLVMRFTVTGDENDYLVCTDVHGNTVNVAKPYELQKTPFHSSSATFFADPTSVSYSYTGTSVRTASYTVDDEDVEEEQIITPAYIDNGALYAVYCDTGLLDDDGKPIFWLDLNTAGRQWGVSA